MLSQTPVICKYLGKKFGLYPDTEEDEFHADQLNSTIHDFITEGDCHLFSAHCSSLSIEINHAIFIISHNGRSNIFCYKLNYITTAYHAV